MAGFAPARLRAVELGLRGDAIVEHQRGAREQDMRGARVRRRSGSGTGVALRRMIVAGASVVAASARSLAASGCDVRRASVTPPATITSASSASASVRAGIRNGDRRRRLVRSSG